MQWASPPSALFERYGVTARQVFGASPNSKSSSSGAHDLPPLLSSRTVGTQSWSSFEGLSSRSGYKTGAADADDEDASGGSPLQHALSLGELRNIVLGQKPPKVRHSPGDDQQLASKRSQGMPAASESPPRAKRQRGKGQRSRGSSAGALGIIQSPDSKLGHDLSSPARQSMSSKADGEEGSDEGEGELEDDEYGEGEVSSDPGVEEESWSGGGVTDKDPLGPPGGMRHQAKKKKPTNPFKVYEDREQRLQLERSWLMNSDNSSKSYMAERMRDMRLDAVYSRRSRNQMSADELYEDTVYFGQYSTELKSLLKKKDLERQSKRKGIAHSSNIFGTEGFKVLKKTASESNTHGGMGLAFEALEAQQQAKAQQNRAAEKNQKHRADKSTPTIDAMSLQRLQMVLQESGRLVEKAHDMVP